MSVTGPRVTAFFDSLRKSQQLSIGVAGFCWGGKHAILLTHKASGNGTALVDAAFTAHPSGLDLPADINAVDVPLSIAIGTKDMVMNMKAITEARTALEANTGVPHELVVYEGARHGTCILCSCRKLMRIGFACRGNPSDDREEEQAGEAENQAVAWFTKHLQTDG